MDLKFAATEALPQAGAWLDGLDDALVVRAAHDVNAVAAGNIASLAAREARQQRAIGKFNEILAPVGGNDTTFHHSLKW